MKKNNAPRWAFKINGVVFHELTAEQNALINQGNEIKREFESGIHGMTPPEINSRWGPICDGANEGDPDSTKLYRECHGDRATYVRFCEMENAARTHQHLLAHHGFLERTKEIPAQIIKKLEDFRNEYVDGQNSPRRLMGLPRDPEPTDAVFATITHHLIGVTNWLERNNPGAFELPSFFCGELLQLNEEVAS